ncbi:hypothetical protein, partial [Sutterella seckii]|uniref:hypothetical protein n=1 Tax=Sutterella seckii TaxID=1944635 RepID=UPI001D03E9FF
SLNIGSVLRLSALFWVLSAKWKNWLSEFMEAPTIFQEFTKEQLNFNILRTRCKNNFLRVNKKWISRS